MKNVKEFVKEQKMEILISIGAGVIAGGMYYLGWKGGLKYIYKTSYVVHNETIKTVLRSASVGGPKTLTGVWGKLVTMEQLGEFGEYLISECGDKSQVFTHFIMIGPEVVKGS